MKARYLAMIIIVSIIVVLVIGCIIMFKVTDRNLKNLTQMTVTTPPLAGLGDGTYEGSYSAFPIIAKVEVTVADHAIRNIALVKHQNGQGQAAKGILGEVIQHQSLDVDTISGATYSSMVILKAIEDGLNQAKAVK